MPAAERATAALTVDLAAIVENYRILQRRFAGGEVAVSLKADAYGLGAASVGASLWRAGARRFFVATLDEAIALRAQLPSAAIAVLHGLTSGPAAEFLRYDLLPVHNSIAEIDAWLAEAPGRPAGLHLDTGMARLGMPADEVAALAGSGRLRGLPLAFVMSHLACADDAFHPLNALQQGRFVAACAALAIPDPVPRSLVASSGIFRDTSCHFDIARPGAALYGISPTPGRPNPMRPVVRLSGKILQLRYVDTDSTVGYGATHRMTRAGRVATIGAGYADGVLRALGNRGHAVADGHRVPVVGRVSMDLLTIDVTGLPEEAVQPGASVDLIGPGHDIDEFAAAAGTIGYEVLTRLGPRLARRYLPDGEPAREDAA
jgi:alanine racemase